MWVPKILEEVEWREPVVQRLKAEKNRKSYHDVLNICMDLSCYSFIK